MLPFKEHDYFYNDTNRKSITPILGELLYVIVIKDDELKKGGFYDPDANIYDVDEDLLYFRNNQ